VAIFGSNRIDDAIKALEAERDTGVRAELPPDLERLGALFARRSGVAPAPSAAPPVAAWRTLLMALPDAVAVLDEQGTVTACNAALDALAPGKRAAGLKLLEAVRAPELTEAVRAAREGTPRRVEFEVGVVPRVWQAWTARIDGAHTLLAMRDVTEARRAAASRRDFAANASHELRTPIAAIYGAAETLLEGAVESPDDARHFASIIARHASRLARLTADLLDLSRIESGQWPIQLGATLVEPIAQGALELHRAAASARGVTLRCELPPRFWARADARALEQILVNLVDNAVKYTREGGSVAVRGERSDREHVTITVVDDGDGIERHHLPRLFERFYRVDPGRSREQGGTGLGLAIVKHLAQAQGGEVGVESGPGGTRFWVRLGAA
jgi:two-component system phosphate regulon sensor histidine kinase PhoR